MKTTLKRTLAVTILMAIIGTFVYARQCIITGNVSVYHKTQPTCVWVSLTNENSYPVTVTVKMLVKDEVVGESSSYYLAAKGERGYYVENKMISLYRTLSDTEQSWLRVIPTVVACKN